MKKTFFLLFILSALNSPLVAFDASELTLTRNIKQAVLPNGLKIIVKEEKSIPLVGFSVTYKVGFRNEDTNGRTGLTHLLEHMMFKGTPTYKKGEIAKTLSDAGARFNAFTGYDKTVYWEILPSGAFETAVKIEADRMANSLIDRQEFAKEKNVVLSELTHYESNPGSKLSRKLNEAVFGTQPYAHSYGFIDDMRNADRDYVYNELYKKYYCPNNAVIVVAGNIDTSEAIRLITRYFGGIKPNPSLGKDKPVPMTFRKGQSVKVEGVASENFGNIYFKFPGWDTSNRDFITLFFISQTGLLGDLGYDPSIDGGIGALHFSEEPDYPAETIDRNYITKNLERFKQRWFRQETLGYDSIDSIMMNLVYLERKSGIRAYDELARGFEKLTADDVISVIRRYLTRENSSEGFFRAVSQDDRAHPRDISQTSESFGSDIDFSDMDNPDAESVKKTRALGKTVFNNALKAVSTYLSDVRETRLKNGLTIITKPYKLNRKVSISVGIRSGTINQNIPNLADTTWQFVFEGGPQIRLRNELENRGASFGGGNDNNYSSYDIEIAADDFGNGIGLLALALTNRSFNPVVLEEKKFNAILSLDEFKKSPSADAHASRELQKMIYGNKGPGMDLFAGPEQILNLTLTNVRDYYRSYYRPENTVIVVVGDIPQDKIIDKIRNSLEGWAQDEPVLSPPAPSLEKPASDTTIKTTLPVMQSIVLMAAPSADYSHITNYIALSLANQIFGGGSLTSRLARIIRDKYGLTYGVFSYLAPYGTNSIFNLYMQNASSDIPKALAIFREELARFKKDGPNDLEIAKFKNNLLSSVIFHYENGSSIANELLYFKMRRNDPKGDEQFIRILNSLDRETILKAVREGFPESYFISIAGN